MFKLVEQARAWWPVTFPGVTEEGEVVDNRFDLRFLIQTEDDFWALFTSGLKLVDAIDGQREASGEPGAEPPPSYSQLAAEFVQKIAIDWRGVAAENGEPLKWEPENIRRVMNVPGVFPAVLKAYKACRDGRKETRAGNSEPSRATGPAGAAGQPSRPTTR